MARGGRRTGTPGHNYANRKDLRGTQPVQAPSGGQYGERKAIEEAQQAQPLANLAGQSQAQAQPQQGGASPVLPGSLGALNRPSERPNQPVTEGAALGPGAGLDAIGFDRVDDETVAELQAVYQTHPSEGIRQLLEAMDG